MRQPSHFLLLFDTAGRIFDTEGRIFDTAGRILTQKKLN